MNCLNCGAPLDDRTNLCGYCGTFSDMDLRATGRLIDRGPKTQRLCPHCDVLLRTMNVGARNPFSVERCDKCFGIFLDPGELRALLDATASGTPEIDHERLKALAEEGMAGREEVKYIPCPDCGELMNRRAYAIRSGVVIDRCKKHGIWLDGGELRRLLRWVKAGGLHADIETQREAIERARQCLPPAPLPVPLPCSYFGSGGGVPLLELAIRFVLRVLR